MMALTAHQLLLKYRYNIEITWLVNQHNSQLLEELTAGSLPFLTMDLANPLRLPKLSFRALRQIIKVSRAFRRNRLDLVVLLQGGIISSYGGVFAARLADVDVCSYIAMTQRSTDLAKYRFPRLWNAMRSVFYKLIPQYITIDDAQAENIRRENSSASILTVENYVPPLHREPSPRTEARKHLDLPHDAIVIAVIGRIDFAQKAQDWLVRELHSDSFLADKTLLLVGDGPDAHALSQLCEKSPNRSRIRIIGWRKNMDQIYSAVDLVLIPSLVEGVPLTMLESLARRIPVVGSDRDGMSTWLPSKWRFPFGNAEMMKAAINCALASDSKDDWVRINAHLKQITDERRFMREVGDALLSCCAGMRHSRPGASS
jgi:glycosyltransferase involved in cell wall biosynthesis